MTDDVILVQTTKIQNFNFKITYKFKLKSLSSSINKY